MNGAIAVPLVNMIIAPKSISVIMIGKSQNFLRFFRNPQRSLRKSIFFSTAKYSYFVPIIFAHRAWFDVFDVLNIT
jgi:hypothetical protein